MNKYCWIELLVLDSNTCNHFTVYKQMIYYWIELLVLNSNTCNHFTVYKQMINIK